MPAAKDRQAAALMRLLRPLQQALLRLDMNRLMLLIRPCLLLPGTLLDPQVRDADLVNLKPAWNEVVACCY